MSDYKTGGLYWAWYPQPGGEELELYYFIPTKVGEQYMAGGLYLESTTKHRLRLAQRVQDVCRGDVSYLSPHDLQELLRAKYERLSRENAQAFIPIAPDLEPDLENLAWKLFAIFQMFCIFAYVLSKAL